MNKFDRKWVCTGSGCLEKVSHITDFYLKTPSLIHLLVDFPVETAKGVDPLISIKPNIGLFWLSSCKPHFR